MSGTNVYAVGQLVRLSAAFTALDVDGVTYVDRDPTVVTITCRQPDGTKNDYIYGTDAELEKDSTGHYHVDIPTPISGEYWYRVAGTGTAEAASEDSFYVRPSYVTAK